MRTSNKLLLGLILTGILLIANLFIAVRVQYARGAIVAKAASIDKADHWADVHQLDGTVKTVSINGLKNVLFVPAKAARLEIDKYTDKKIAWKLDNGVLTISADSTGDNAHAHIELFLPAVDSVIANYSSIDVKNTGDSASAPSYTFSLNRSIVDFNYDGRYETSKPFTRYGAIQVDAQNESEVKFGRGIVVDKFTGSLRSSTLKAESKDIQFNDKPQLRVDDNSVLHLSSKNLRQAIITSIE